jgi:hypothetical protein
MRRALNLGALHNICAVRWQADGVLSFMRVLGSTPHPREPRAIHPHGPCRAPAGACFVKVLLNGKAAERLPAPTAAYSRINPKTGAQILPVFI